MAGMLGHCSVIFGSSSPKPEEVRVYLTSSLCHTVVTVTRRHTLSRIVLLKIQGEMKALFILHEQSQPPNCLSLLVLKIAFVYLT